jgi:hypothetical protein
MADQEREPADSTRAEIDRLADMAWRLHSRLKQATPSDALPDELEDVALSKHVAEGLSGLRNFA